MLRHNPAENIHAVFTHFWEQENPKESRELTCLHCYDQLPAGNIEDLEACPSCDTEFDDHDRLEMHQSLGSLPTGRFMGSFTSIEMIF